MPLILKVEPGPATNKALLLLQTTWIRGFVGAERGNAKRYLGTHKAGKIGSAPVAGLRFPAPAPEYDAGCSS